MPMMPPPLGGMTPPPMGLGSPPGMLLGGPGGGGLPGGGPQGAPPMGGPMGGVSPQGAMAASMVGGMNQAGQDLDLFQRVAKMTTDNPMWIYLFAGMGLREALEKSGKFESKPHRSNDQLAQSGYPGAGGPQPGQAGGGNTPLASPPQMMNQMTPGMPGVPGA